MASLDDLIMNEILTPEQKAARVQEVLNGTMPGALRQYGQTTQQQNEAAFGKGMGLSTWNAYQQALNSLMEREGTGKIKNDAQTAVDAAQRAAIGNAIQYQNGRQAAANAQAGNDIQRQALKQRAQLQNQSQMFQGLTGLAGGVVGTGARMFEPEIKGAAKGLYGSIFNKPNQPGQPTTESAPQIGAGQPAGDVGAAGDMNAANSSSYTMPANIGYSDQGSLSTPDYSGYADYMPATYSDPSNWQFNLADLFNSGGGGGSIYDVLGSGAYGAY